MLLNIFKIKTQNEMCSKMPLYKLKYIYKLKIMTYCYKDLSFDKYPFFVLSIIGTKFSASLVLSTSIK